MMTVVAASKLHHVELAGKAMSVEAVEEQQQS
jgi:hypothetical protein